MRLTRLLLVGGLTAALALPAGSASATPDRAWVRADRTALFSLTAVAQGDLPGHEGNWHTVVLSVSGDDGIAGVVTDWTCAEGVEPNYQDAEDAWVCAVESRAVLDDLVDALGVSGLVVRVNRPTRNLLIHGEVLATDAEGVASAQRVHLLAHAYGPLTRTVTDTGPTRVVVEERSRTRVRGRVLGLRLHRLGFAVDTSTLVAVSTYVRKP